ncbi:MAG: PH domain-containing protein [Janthinobacterium lividum]
MKFKSKKSFLVGIIFGAACLLMIGISTKVLIYDHGKRWIGLISILPLFFLVLTWFNTYYVIENKMLIYKSGFINGSIKIEEIHQITIGKQMYIGLKPALSSDGCIVSYRKWDDIYISPKNQELFNEELLKINPEIIVKNVGLK